MLGQVSNLFILLGVDGLTAAATTTTRLKDAGFHPSFKVCEVLLSSVKTVLSCLYAQHSRRRVKSLLLDVVELLL
ncbi:MAG: hypothetical protein DBX62_06620 [Clostridia bacterium]|nr:MAG: hypothetical protein DBX62_06620 [Clostridia bacterium]